METNDVEGTCVKGYLCLSDFFGSSLSAFLVSGLSVFFDSSLSAFLVFCLSVVFDYLSDIVNFFLVLDSFSSIVYTFSIRIIYSKFIFNVK